MKKTFLYVGTMLLFFSPFLVKAVPWEPPTDNAPNANVDGPVWISPTTPQQGSINLTGGSATFEINPSATTTPINDITVSGGNQPALLIQDTRSTDIGNATLSVQSNLAGRPAIYGENTQITGGGYGGQFIGTSAPGLNVEGGIEFIGDTVDPSTYQTAGLLYYNTTDNAFKYYNGSTWRQLNTPWEINGDEIYHSQTAGTAKGVAIKTGDTTDPNDNYTLDVVRKAQSSSDRGLNVYFEDYDSTDYVSGSLGYFNGSYIVGVRGNADVTNGMGVFGSAGTNGSRGVHGTATNGYGVSGYASSGVGVHGQGDYGVVGSGDTTGGSFIATGSYGVKAEASGTGNVINYGGSFVASGDHGRGIEATADATGVGIANYGVMGRANGDRGFGVYGTVSGDSAHGVYGLASATGAVTNYGGWFKAAGDSGIGVYAAGPTTPTTTALALKLDKGAMAMEELTTLPTNTADYGKLYVKSADSKIYFLDASGTEYDLTAGSGASGTIADGTADGQIPFWDNTAGEWTYTETSEMVWDDTNKRVGVGVASPNEALTASGALALSETTAPTNTASYGKFYVNSTDSLPYFVDDSGTEYDLTAGSGSADIGGGTADGQFTFWDNTAGEWTYTETSEMVWDDTNQNVGIGVASPTSTNKLHVQQGASDARAVYGNATATGVGVQNYGGYFEAAGDNGSGVYGEAARYGVEGRSTSGWGVRGHDSGDGVGGEFSSSTGTGLIARSYLTGTSYGIAGGFYQQADNGYAVHGVAGSETGSSYGGSFQSEGDTGTGVKGYASAFGVGVANVGGDFEANGDNGIGLKATGPGTATGSALRVSGGAIDMRELTTLPTNTSAYGKLYVKSADSKIYFQDDGGTEYDLTAGIGASGTIADGTADGQFTFWDNTAGEWINTETSEMVWDDTNKNIGIGVASPTSTNKLEVDNTISSSVAVAVAVNANATNTSTGGGDDVYGIKATATGGLPDGQTPAEGSVFGGHFTASEGDISTGVYGNGQNNGGIFTSSGMLGVSATSSSPNGTGVKGEATGNGSNIGGDFTAAGDTGIGVHGWASNTGAVTNYGGYFGASGDTGVGVYGTGDDKGVSGFSSTGIGIYGEANDINSTTVNYGGRFKASGGQGIAVFGEAVSPDTENAHYGGYFTADGGNGIGLYATGAKEAARFEDSLVVISNGADFIDYADLSGNSPGSLYVGSVLEVDGTAWIGGMAYIGGEMQAPIFKDLNNTAYYLDPASTTSGRLYGNLQIGYGSATDEDFIYFDQNAEYLKWDNAANRFEFSDNLYAYRMYATYMYPSRVYSDYLYADANIYADGNIYVDNDYNSLYDYVYFGGTSGNSDYMRYYSTSDEFQFSGDMKAYGDMEANRYYGSSGSTTYYIDPDDDAISAVLAGNLIIGRSSSSDDDIIYFDYTNETLKWDEGTDRFEMTDDLYITGNYSSSDGRFKKERESIDNALGIVENLKPIKHKWDFSADKERPEAQNLDGKTDIGFVAQDVYDYLPELVFKPDNLEEDLWSLDYAKITAVLTAAMQEQQAQIENQQKEIDELKEQVKYLMDKVE